MHVVVLTYEVALRAALATALAARCDEAHIVDDWQALEACAGVGPVVMMVDAEVLGAGAADKCVELRTRIVPPPFVAALLRPCSEGLLAGLLAAGVGDFIEWPRGMATLSARLGIIEERIRAESLLREGEEKFRSMVSNIPGIVYRSVADQAGRELGLARTARRMEFLSEHVSSVVGYDLREFHDGGRTYASLVHPADAERVTLEVEAACAERRPFEIEYRMVHADGTARWVSSRGRASFGPKGEFRFLDGAVFDITEEKLARERLADKSEELARANERLQRLDQQKSRMFQNVTHELRTPLTLILSPLESALATSDLAPQTRARLDAMHRNALRLLGLVNDVLDLAKLESAKVPVRAEPVDVVGFLQHLLADAMPAAEAKGLSLRLLAPTHRPRYLLDPAHLERVLFNLVSNAFKFTPREGSVDVLVEETSDGLVIAVRDSGVGIPEEASERIFRRFEQADDSSTRDHGGTGIGLTLARDLARLMGGEVSVASVVGSGTRFDVSFPANLRATAGAKPASDYSPTLTRRAAVAALENTTRPPHERRGGSHGPLVLIAEDDPGVSEELFELLVPHYRVATVSNGEQALAEALAQTPHVIVSDVMMPKMDGLQLVAELRERMAFRDTAIILLSARGELEDRVRGRQAGVDTYLSKPFHREEVLATIAGLLRARMRVVGSFLLHEALGSGGQGTVFRAEHLTTGETAAIKLVTSIDDTNIRTYLRREQEGLARISHPNVVRIFEQGIHENRLYVAMEYLEGSTLWLQLKREGKQTATVVRDVACAVCAALEAVHGEGLLHRDIKPSNIMLLGGSGPVRDRVRVIDFGAVLDLNGAAPDELLVGSLHYLAPELLAGLQPTVLSDIYALGVSMFVLSVGTVPHPESDPGELLAAIRTRSSERVEGASGVAAPLRDIIMRAMDADPAQRWQSALELRLALDALELSVDGPPSLPSAPDVPTMEAARRADVSATERVA